MKNKRSQIVGIILAILLIVPSQTIFGLTPNFKFQQEQINVGTGKPFSVKLRGEAITSLYGYEVALVFDQDKVEIVGKPSVKFVQGFSVGPTKGSDGKIYFGFTQLGKKEGVKGNVDLAELSFKAKQPGIHTIVVESIKIVDSSLNAQQFKVGKSISVTAVEKIKNFYDIKGHWAEKSINQIVDKGYMVGKSDTLFKPNDKLTRGEMAEILSRIVTVKEIGSNTFIDIKGNEWYAQSVLKMSHKGLIKGYADNTFGPVKPITTAETMSVLARIARQNNSYQQPTTIDQILKPFKDAAQVPSWAKEEIAWAIENGLIKGDDQRNLNVTHHISRAQTAAILSRFLDLELIKK